MGENLVKPSLVNWTKWVWQTKLGRRAYQTIVSRKKHFGLATSEKPKNTFYRHYDNPDQPHKMGHTKQIFDNFPDGNIHFISWKLTLRMIFSTHWPLNMDITQYSTVALGWVDICSMSTNLLFCYILLASQKEMTSHHILILLSHYYTRDSDSPIIIPFHHIAKHWFIDCWGLLKHNSDLAYPDNN